MATLIEDLSGVANGVARGGRVPPLTVKKLPKMGGKIRKKEEKSGRKDKNRDGSFTLPLLTDRAGYATGGSPIAKLKLIEKKKSQTNDQSPIHNSRFFPPLHVLFSFLSCNCRLFVFVFLIRAYLYLKVTSKSHLEGLQASLEVAGVKEQICTCWEIKFSQIAPGSRILFSSPAYKMTIFMKWLLFLSGKSCNAFLPPPPPPPPHFPQVWVEKRLDHY